MQEEELGLAVCETTRRMARLFELESDLNVVLVLSYAGPKDGTAELFEWLDTLGPYFMTEKLEFALRIPRVELDRTKRMVNK